MVRDRIKIQLLNEDAKIPALGSAGAAGFDLHATVAVEIPPQATFTIPLGFSTELPDNIHARIESRSGLAIRGLVVLTGVIDADYRGEWKVILRNVNALTPLRIAKGDRIAQAVLRPTIRLPWTQVEALESTSRGSGGFGSTGSA